MFFVTTLARANQGRSWKQNPRSLYCAPTLATHPINYLVSSCPLSQSYVFCHAINNVTILITHINMHTPTVAGHMWAKLPYLLSMYQSPMKISTSYLFTYLVYLFSLLSQLKIIFILNSSSFSHLCYRMCTIMKRYDNEKKKNHYHHPK